MKVTVITFPGSNCDKDVGGILEQDFQTSVRYLWHKDSFQDFPDLVILPGGFSYGDYLRCGAMAKFSKAMESVRSYVAKGGWVLGICNGFQILTESGLLPGALRPNRSLKYICKDVELLPDPKNPLFGALPPVTLPIAHGEGAFYADPETISVLEKEGRILFRYKDNPNGSLQSIAGISDARGRVLGMMPHPERAMNPYTKKRDGSRIFQEILSKL